MINTQVKNLPTAPSGAVMRAALVADSAAIEAEINRIDGVQLANAAAMASTLNQGAAQVAQAAGAASNSDASRVAALAAAGMAANSLSAAQTASDSAAAAWTAALAANPALDPVVRMNPSTIANDLTIPSFYNAASNGPITIGEGVNVTLSDNSIWSIQ